VYEEQPRIPGKVNVRLEPARRTPQYRVQRKAHPLAPLHGKPRRFVQHDALIVLE
jgi:hypothetical protein